MTRWSHWYPHAIATGALLLGCVVYLIARPDSLFYAGGGFVTPLNGSLPSFLHTLSFALAGSLLIAHRRAAIFSVVLWGALEGLAELAQHEFFPVPTMLETYQHASTFDLLDLYAILAAVAVAILVTAKRGH